MVVGELGCALSSAAPLEAGEVKGRTTAASKRDRAREPKRISRENTLRGKAGDAEFNPGPNGIRNVDATSD